MGKVKRGREKQMMKEKTIETPITTGNKELFSIGWTAHPDLVAV